METTRRKGEVLSGAEPGACFDTSAGYGPHFRILARPKQCERRTNTRCSLLSAGGLTAIDVLGVQTRLGSGNVPQFSNPFQPVGGDFSTRSPGGPTSEVATLFRFFVGSIDAIKPVQRVCSPAGVWTNFGSLVNPVGSNLKLSLDEAIRAVGLVVFELSHVNGVEDG
jgi:hypothetical protein